MGFGLVSDKTYFFIFWRVNAIYYAVRSIQQHKLYLLLSCELFFEQKIISEEGFWKLTFLEILCSTFSFALL